MTLLPNKHIPTNRSLVGVGSLLLGHIQSPLTVSTLWEQVKVKPEVGSFRNFVLALDFLFAIGALDYNRGFLSRSQR